jgi:hypothetical protein
VGTRRAMRQPEDALLIALAHGLEGLMLGTTTPSTPEAIGELLGDMENAGSSSSLTLTYLGTGYPVRHADRHSLAP